MSKEIVMNPDILPTLEEWRLICKMVKQQRELTDEEMLEVYKKLFNKKNEFKENLKRRSYFDFALAILEKATEKATCNKCNDTGWVCEWHPDKEAHMCCGGAGMPCECTKE